MSWLPKLCVGKFYVYRLAAVENKNANKNKKVICIFNLSKKLQTLFQQSVLKEEETKSLVWYFKTCNNRISCRWFLSQKSFKWIQKEKKIFLESFKQKKIMKILGFNCKDLLQLLTSSSWQSLKTTFCKFASKHLSFGWHLAKLKNLIYVIAKSFQHQVCAKAKFVWKTLIEYSSHRFS
jgi:hypothetical protein